MTSLREGKKNLTPGNGQSAKLLSDFERGVRKFKHTCNKVARRLELAEDYYKQIVIRTNEYCVSPINEVIKHYLASQTKSNQATKICRIFDIYLVPFLAGLNKEFNLLKKGQFDLACEEFSLAVSKTNDPETELLDSDSLLSSESLDTSQKHNHIGKKPAYTFRNCTFLYEEFNRLAEKSRSESVKDKLYAVYEEVDNRVEKLRTDANTLLEEIVQKYFALYGLRLTKRSPDRPKEFLNWVSFRFNKGDLKAPYDLSGQITKAFENGRSGIQDIKTVQAILAKSLKHIIERRQLVQEQTPLAGEKKKLLKEGAVIKQHTKENCETVPYSDLVTPYCPSKLAMSSGGSAQQFFLLHVEGSETSSDVGGPPPSDNAGPPPVDTEVFQREETVKDSLAKDLEADEGSSKHSLLSIEEELPAKDLEADEGGEHSLLSIVRTDVATQLEDLNPSEKNFMIENFSSNWADKEKLQYNKLNNQIVQFNEESNPVVIPAYYATSGFSSSSDDPHEQFEFIAQQMYSINMDKLKIAARVAALSPCVVKLIRTSGGKYNMGDVVDLLNLLGYYLFTKMCDAAEASILSNQMQIHDESALAHSILVPDRLPSCLAMELEVARVISRLRREKLWPHLPEEKKKELKSHCQKVTREMASELFTHLTNIMQNRYPALSSLIIRDKAKITMSEIRQFQQVLREVPSNEPFVSGYKLLANAIEKGTRDCRIWLRQHTRVSEERTRRADERSQAREMEEISPLSKTAKRSAVYSRDNRPRKAKKMAENEVEEEKKEEEEEGMEEGEELVEEEEEEEKEEESRKKKEEEEEGMEEGEEVVEEEEEEEEEEESRKKKEEEETVSPFIGKEVSINSEDEIVFSANRVEQLLQYYQVNRIIETLGNITHFTEEPKHQEAVDSSTRPIQPAAASSSSNNPQVKGKRKPDPKIRGARASLMAALKLMDDIFEFEEEE